MNKKSVIMAAVFLAAGLSPAIGQGLIMDFDGNQAGLPAAALSKEAQTAVMAPAPSVAPAVNAGLIQKGYAEPRQCKSFIYSSGGAYRQYVKFQTSFTQQVCNNTYYTDSNGNSAMISQCHDENRHYSAGIELYIGERNLRSGETEEIKFCYNFPDWKGSVTVKDSPIEYSYRTNEEVNGFLPVTLSPLRRKPVNPAEGMVELRSFTYDANTREFTLKIDDTFTDLYNDYYGEKIVIGVELMQDKLFNSSRGTKNFEFTVGWLTREYTVVFKQSDLTGDKDDGETKGRDKKYFVKWGFQMKGAPFTDKFIEKEKTESITVR